MWIALRFSWIIPYVNFIGRAGIPLNCKEGLDFCLKPIDMQKIQQHFAGILHLRTQGNAILWEYFLSSVIMSITAATISLCLSTTLLLHGDSAAVVKTLIARAFKSFSENHHWEILPHCWLGIFVKGCILLPIFEKNYFMIMSPILLGMKVATGRGVQKLVISRTIFFNLNLLHVRLKSY